MNGDERVEFIAIVDSATLSCKNCGKSGMTSLDAGLHRCNIAGVAEVARADERAKIVQWLKQPETVMSIMTAYDDRRKDGTLTKTSMENRGVALMFMMAAAERIAAGDHMQSDGED